VKGCSKLGSVLGSCDDEVLTTSDGVRDIDARSEKSVRLTREIRTL